MRRENIAKAFLCAACAVCIVVLDIVLVRLFSAETLDLKEVPVAAHNIGPREEITEEDFVLIKVAGDYLMNNAYQSSEEILGKYTDIQGKIPEGSPFYKAMLFNAESLPDHPVLQLQEGESLYSYTGDSTSFGSLTPGLRADIHVTITGTGMPSSTGILIEHARILSIRDHQGVSITSKDSSGIPYMIEAAVNKEDLDILTFAESIGQLRFFASSDSYQDAEASLCTESPVVQYLQQKIQESQNNPEN